MKLLRIHLPDALHARLKVQCAMDVVSMQAAAVEAIEEWLSERGVAWAQVRAEREKEKATS